MVAQWSEWASKLVPERLPFPHGKRRSADARAAGFSRPTAWAYHPPLELGRVITRLMGIHFTEHHRCVYGMGRNVGIAGRTSEGRSSGAMNGRAVQRRCGWNVSVRGSTRLTHDPLNERNGGLSPVVKG
jgi:hypothetical protein